MHVGADSTIQDPSRSAARLIQEAHLRDGLPEFAAAASFFIFGAICWMRFLLPFSPLTFGVSIALTLAFVVLCIKSATIVKRLRRRYLVERSGYVERRFDPRLQRRRWTGAALALVFVTAAIIVGWTGHARLDGWILAGLGVFIGSATMHFGLRLRFKINGILAVLTGIILAARSFPPDAGYAIFYTVMGSANLISGSIAFGRFMHETAQDAGA